MRCVKMLNFFLGIFAGYIILSFIHEELWDQRWVDFIQLPYLLIRTGVEIILEILLFPFIFLWHLFRNVNKPVKMEAIQNLKLMDASTHLFGGLYVCHDKTAKGFVNNFFFYIVLRRCQVVTRMS